MTAAARSQDDVGHGFGMLGLLAGVVAGAVVGALLVTATAATGGLALFLFAGALAGGGLAGRKFARGLQVISKTPDPTTGALATGAPNVFIGGRAAARAKLDSARSCHGLYSVHHFPLFIRIPIAEGSATVYINGQPTARVKDRLICGAKIKEGEATVNIGGGTAQVLPVIDAEEIMATILEVVGVASLIGVAVFGGVAAFAAGGLKAAVLFAVNYTAVNGTTILGFELLRRVGDSFGPGYGDLFEGIAGLGALGLSGYRANEVINPMPTPNGPPGGKVVPGDIQNGKLSTKEVGDMIPKGTPNKWTPGAPGSGKFEGDGFRYEWTDPKTGTNYTVWGHNANPNAPAGSNSANGPTVRIKINNRLVTTSGTTVGNKPSKAGITHIPFYSDINLLLDPSPAGVAATGDSSHE